MNRSGDVLLDFAGEERPFRLPIGRLRVLQERVDAGPMELLKRYEAGTWRVDDVREAILQGLIGGGMDQAAATRLMIQFFDGFPLLRFVTTAQCVVLAALAGAPEEDDEDKPSGEPAASPPSPTARSASGDSTAAAPSSGSPPARSMN